MRKQLDYNEYGPETCLTDELFMLLWEFYTTHDLPLTESGKKLIKIFDLPGLPRLKEAELFDPDKITDATAILIATKYKVDCAFFKACMMSNYTFWTFTGSGFSWKSCRFADPDMDSTFVSVENLKHLIRQMAIEEGILSEYQEVGGTQ